MTTIRGPGGPARPTGPGRSERGPEPGKTEAPTRKSAEGLAGHAEDSFVSGESRPRPAIGAAGRAAAPTESPGTRDVANLKTLEASARGQFEAAESIGKLYEKLSAKVSEVATLAEGGDTDKLMLATREMQEMNMGFNLQYLQLQQAMQSQNRQFTLVSNIMKTKHDTAKAALQNIR